ncbi:TauD/TfdA family dioxygenase [Streptomyces sp. Je 1-4]|uniref:TauD/TfdA family dioxygenase n=1 Tax=Streptomyces TaxID=1883 RepID=UPI00140F37AE|nr:MULTISPECIES: TauD/TfdA family dioxygenase [unclassified Streptomyces]QIK10174.1 oxygenase [Streptomyces sp. ID38640]UYB43935.1 TauD/TfdA family dioxygenase [Streptomyces sp. Je 1-4]UZQ40357.1 TauD/TfdA family dioxygenase [Streptomyces sp. Je 1-4] [Streptomyces sp. Je 1-4 4N24]UZQ47774.1 TauD/TfdA family dioxygenase [Streptomyces sp. Je 1-4] [Streptomyces sp. Je 1-4 4N24_ara]
MSTAAAPVRTLDDRTASELRRTAEKILAEFGASTATPLLLTEVAQAAAGFDDTLRHHCRPVDTADGLFVLRGLDVDDDAIGPTPSSWATADGCGAPFDLQLLLLASVMGNPLAWEGQQDGRFVHNIVPSAGRESEQTGASSTVLLSPHTEDAFHPRRAHLLMLGCVRNPDGIATTAASIRKARLTDEDLGVLSRAVVPILPDDAYAEAQGYAGQTPPAVPTLFAAEEGPTLRFDPAYTPLDEADGPYRAAYGRLTAELARVSVAVSLSPGEVLVVDNDLVVHGRVPFQARYDGSDRWLKRASVRVPGRRSRPLAEAGEHGYGQAALEAPTS